MPKVNTADTNRALLQSKLLELAVVKSVHTCRRIFPFVFFCFFLFFLLYLQTFYLLLLNNSYPSSPGFMRMNWAQLLSTTLDKKRTILEIRGEKNAVPGVISCSISAGQKSRTVVDRTCPALIAPDRA